MAHADTHAIHFSACPDGYGELGDTGTCYKLDHTRVNYEEARVTCEGQEDGSLAIVTSQTKYDFIKTMMVEQ